MIKLARLTLLLVASIAGARADSLTWDQLGGGTLGGSGTWNLNSTANWYNGAADVKWLDNSALGTNSAIFSGTAGAITLNTSLSASNLQFTTAGYTLSGAGTLTLGAGGIDTSALGSGTTTIGNSLSLSGGQQLWQSGSGGILAINGAITRSTGAAVDFSASGITSSILANDVTGILGAWATVGAANGAASGDWAANDGSGNIIPYAGYTVGTAIAGGTATQNWKNTANATVTANTTINSLVQQADVTVSSGTTLTLNSGGLVLWGVSRWMIANSTTTTFLKSGLSTGELFVHVPSPSSGNNWTLWPVITDAAVPAKFIKDGAGLVKMGNNNNTYSGGTIVNAGVLGSRNPVTAAGLCTPFGTGSITVNNAQLQLGTDPTSASGEYDITNSVTLNGGTLFAWDAFQHAQGSLIVGANGGTLGATFNNKGDALNKGFGKGIFIDGLVTGTGNLTVQHSGLNTGNAWNSSTVYFTSQGTAAQNTYSGTITVNPSVAPAGNGGSFLYLIGTNALANATINLTGDNSASAGRYGSPTLLFGSGTNLDGIGYATIGGLAGTGSFPLANTKVVQSGSSLGAAVALTVGNNNSSSTYSGIMSGAGSLTKVGNGTLTLAGANTYTGNTTINGGALVLTAGFVSSTNITVGTGATLDVSALSPVTLSASQVLSSGGTNIGSINTTAGSKIYAGTDGGYGTNRFRNDLTLVTGALTYLDVGTLVNGSNDLITVAGTLTANNNSIHLKAPSGASLQTADYTLISSANAISGTFSGTPIWDVPPANAGNFSIVTSGNTVKLHYSANSAPSGGGFATPSSVTRNQKTLLTVLVTNGVPGTVQTVVVDASTIGGSAAFSLVRSNLSNVFTNTIAPTAATVAGVKALSATITDNTPLNAIASIALTVTTTNDVWNGAAANDFFSSNLNWSNLTAPGLIGDTLQFAGTTRLTPSMDNNYSVASLLFDSTAGSFIIGTANSSVLTLAGPVTNNSVNAQTLNVPITLDTAQTINTAVGNIALGGAVTGLGSLSKIGSGTLTLSGTGNNLTGTVGITGGALNISGGSTTLGTGFSYAGFRTDSGTLNLTGGSLTTGGDFGVGYSDLNGTTYNATGIVTVANATVSLGGRLIVARGNNNQNTVSGTVTLNNGGILNSEGDVLLGFAGINNLGKVVINGGTLNVASTVIRWLIMGQYDTAQSEVDLNSGNVNINGNAAIRFATGNNTGTNTFNLNGGAVTFYSDNATTIGGAGVLDLHQGTGTTVVNTFNLNGGTLTVPGILSATTSGSRTFNFNGGTLKAAAASGTFMNLGTGTTVANVRNGGAVIDDGGFSINIDQALVHSTIAGDNAADGGLTKSGVGTLALTAAETYTGGTIINAGTLALTGSSSVNNSSNILVKSGAIFDVSGIAFTLGGSQTLSGSGNINGSVTTTAGAKIYAGTDGVYGTNTFNNDLTLVSGVACYLDLGTVNNLTNDQLVVSGTLTANNNVLHLKAPSTSVNLDTTADYVLFTAGTISGTFASAPVWDVAPLNAGHYTVVTSGNTVTLHYSASVSSPTLTGSANPSTLLRNQSTKITVNVTPGSGAITAVTLDLSSVGGTSATLVRSNLSNIYTNTVIIPATANASSPTLTATATDNNSLSGSASIPLTINISSEVWNGGGGNQNWSTNPNWISGSAPGSTGDSVTFAGSTGLAPSMDNSYSLTGLSFNNTASSFNIGTPNGSILTLTANGITNNSANAQTVNVPVVLAAAETINAAAGDLTLSQTVDNGGALITASGSHNTTLSGGVSGSGGLTKVGNGTLTLSGNNSFTGSTTVSAGGLTIPATGLVAPDGFVTVGDTAGSKAVLTISGGTLQANNNPGQFSSSLVVGTVTNAAGDLRMNSGSVTINQQFGLGNGAGGYAGFSLSGGQVDLGSFLVVAFNNDSSVLNISGGTLNVNANLATIGAGGLGAIGVVNISGGVLNSTATTGSPYNTTGGIFLGEFGTGTLNVSGTGSVLLSGRALDLAVNTGARGTLNLLGGTVTTTAVGQGSGTGTVNFNGGTLQASAANPAFMSGLTSVNVFSGGAIIDDGGNVITVAQPLLAPTGYGVSTISLASGGTGYIDSPIVTITGGSGSGATATALVNPTTGIVTSILVTSPGTGYASSDTLIVTITGGGGSGATANSPVLVANLGGGLTKNGTGTLSLSGANTYTGNTTVNAGILEIAQSNLAASSTVTVAGSAVLQLDFATTNKVASLVLNGVTQVPGVYNNTTSPTYLTGTGSLLVPAATASNPTNILFSVSGNTLALSWPADHLGWILQSQTNNLNTGLTTNWFDVAGSAAVTSKNVPINPATPTVFFRLKKP